jgi:glycosyltransferase involved in cell wall biosynthesis
MRVTFLIPNLGFAGGNRVVAIYAERLKRRGHNVTVVSGTHRKLRLRTKIKSALRGDGWPAEMDASQPYFNELDIPVKVLESLRPIVDDDVPDADVIIATWWETAEWVAALSPRKGAKVHFVQHHEIFPYLPVERARAVYRLPLARIVISRWLAETMSSSYQDDNCFLIYNSVDTAQFFSEPRNKQLVPTVGFLYSTTDFKAPGTHLAALHELKRRLPELKAVAFGSQKIAKAFPWPDWVDFHYRPPQSEIRLIYSKCDLWLCGSRSEGFHLPPIEAMACRCPVVSTRVGGPLDIVEDGVNGFLVDVDDAVGLAAKAFDVLRRSNDEWLSMSDAAEATALRYSWDDATDLFEKALVQIAARAGQVTVSG